MEKWGGGGGGREEVIQIYRNSYHCLCNKIWSDSSEDLRKELDGDIQCKYKSTESRINT